MRSIRLLSLLLIAMAASAQHAGGFRGGSTGFRSGAGVRSGAGRFGPPAAPRQPVVRDGRFSRSGFGFSGRFGNPYFPYAGLYPFIGDYDLFGDYGPAYLPPADYPANNKGLTAYPDAPGPSPAPPPQTAHAVVAEYKWNEPAVASPAVASNDQTATFTIALKDGSKRYPVTAWVQDGKLHCVDLGGHQEVLSTGVIDRDATQRLNHQKNLNLQLPPG